MKCRFCGHEITEDELYCENCGREAFAVPEYNPLDDMLTAQIKVGVNDEENADTDYLYDISDATENIDSSRRRTGNVRNTSPGRNTSPRRNTNPQRNTSSRRNTAAGRNTDSRRNTAAGRNTTGRMMSDRERQRRRAEQRKAALRRKRRKLLTAMAVVIIAIIALCVVLYQNSYNGIINKGYKQLEAQEYNAAEASFEKALAKNEKRADAYTGISKVYIQQDRLQEAEDLFDKAIAEQPKNANIYEVYIGYLLDADQPMSIPVLLDDAQDSVRNKLSDYIIEEPEYSLDEDEIYDDVCQLELTTEAEEIYYTDDGKDPTPKSKKYTGPIQLEEGENVIKAISVNKRGVPSMITEKTYVIEFPIEDAPAISPSTGQYESAQQIEIIVPDGYEAYYTMDGTDPTTASTKYAGPVDMPEGETLFKAILVNSGGRMSGITTRNYMLEIEEEEY